MYLINVVKITLNKSHYFFAPLRAPFTVQSSDYEIPISTKRQLIPTSTSR